MTTPLHIGILAPDLYPQHGWGVYSLGLIRALHAAGVRLTVITAQDSPPVPDLPLTRLLPSVSPMRGAFLLRLAAAFPQARALLRGYDAIHALVEPYAPLAAWLAGERPSVVTLHGTYARLPAKRGVMGAAYRRAFSEATLVCVSRYTESIVGKMLPDAKTVVIHNGINAERFLTIARQPTAPPTILTVGAVKARKGVRDLVAALPAVRQHVENARLVIAGSLDSEPPYVAQVRADIAALGLENAVDLPGRVDDAALRRLYGGASVFVLPARADGDKVEGFGLVLLEAGAAGLPVIGTRDSGTEDAVDDGVTGLLVAQGDSAALAAALTRLLTDAALSARMGAAGRAKAAAQTWDMVAAEYMKLYERNMNHEGTKRHEGTR
jgi:glycosyltransferase involved in cell wall biosynthesis